MSSSSSSLSWGRVKWFNNKSGYGFITLLEDGNQDGKDIFVHHTGIVVNNEQYKYLVQGEYVEFQLEKVNNGNHEYQANHVTGIRGGKLLCETRNENRETRGPIVEGNEVIKEIEEEWKTVKKREKETTSAPAVIPKSRGRPRKTSTTSEVTL
jgi:CspA family cold shock protein